MEEDENVGIFHGKLKDLANQAYLLGEETSKVKMIWKVIRSLSNRFEAKVAATEEAKDLDTFKLDELIGSLQTYELNHFGDSSNKGIALKISNDSDFSNLNDNELADLSKRVSNLLKSCQKNI